MKNSILLLILALLTQPSIAQQSSTDIRHAIGKGPYPIYLAGQLVYARNKHMFSDFTKAYSNEYFTNDINLLNGFEVDLGVTFNDHHFFGIKNWRISGFSLETGYRYLFRNLWDKDKTRQLHLQEEVISIRLGKRLNIIYPFTVQFHVGPSFYNFYSVRENLLDSITNETIYKRERVGTGVFERLDENKKLISGWDFRVRLNIFDPAGTSGGLGCFFEWRYQTTNGDRILDGLYDKFIPKVPSQDTKSWDYGSLTFGLIVPFAFRVIGLQ